MNIKRFAWSLFVMLSARYHRWRYNVDLSYMHRWEKNRIPDEYKTIKRKLELLGKLNIFDGHYPYRWGDQVNFTVHHLTWNNTVVAMRGILDYIRKGVTHIPNSVSVLFSATDEVNLNDFIQNDHTDLNLLIAEVVREGTMFFDQMVIEYERGTKLHLYYDPVLKRVYRDLSEIINVLIEIAYRKSISP